MMTTEGNESDRTIFVRSRPASEQGPDADVFGHYLVMLEGATPGRRVEITAGTPVTVGRQVGETLVYADPELSRRHARFSLLQDRAVVEDLGSTNGTFVDDERMTAPRLLEEGSNVRFGSQVFRYERRSRRDVERSEELDRDLRKASSYVLSLLPAPIESGPVRAEWRFVPSAELGGDAFGYYWLDPDTFVFYLLDVSGHGVGSAMHSLTVLNVLRQRALPDADFRDPASVLSSLNARFQMDGYGGLFFTIWYGVYHPEDRTLVCGSAGHHPAYLVSPDKGIMTPIATPALMIGIVPDSAFDVQRTTVPAGSTLYVFSDGVFEIRTKDHQRWMLSDFLPLLAETETSDGSVAERIYTSIKRVAEPGSLDDDASLMVFAFP